jgi:hypothetical protein
MEKHSVFGVGLDLTLNIYTMSHTFMTANHHRAIVEILTDDILLEVFDWYRQTLLEQWTNAWKWVTLVHVCRRWRHIVFGSPCRLDLWLPCTYGTPVRRGLDCWPSLPIFIKYWANLEFRPPSPEDEDNLIAALEHPDRVRRIQLAVTSSQLEKVAERMQMAFTGLTSLSLWLDKGTTPTLPKTFLAVCASPCLREISLVGVPFPGLPQLLESTIDLVSLRLLEVPDDGYIPPDVMATCLSTLPHLRSLCIDFRSPPSTRHNRGGHRRLAPPMTRDTLPSLTSINFRGTSEYLEDLVAKIDAPFLSEVNISFFNQLIFDVPHLSRFIRQMEVLKSAKVSEVESSPGNGVSITMTLDSDQDQGQNQDQDQDQSHLAVAAGGNATPSSSLGHHNFSLRVTCTDLDWQISSIAQICHQTSLLSNIKHIDIRADSIRLSRREGEDDMVDTVPWLEFFHTFPSVVVLLRICGELGPYVAPALEGIVVDMETVRKVLPELGILLFECSRKSASVERFVAARQLFSRPVIVRHAVSPWVSNDIYMQDSVSLSA